MDLWCCRYTRQMVEPASGLTLQADFYHIDLRAVTVQLDPQFLVNHEDQFPGQVHPRPLNRPG